MRAKFIHGVFGAGHTHMLRLAMVLGLAMKLSLALPMAEAAEIQGRITIKGSSDPASQVQVTLNPLKLKTETQSDGSFKFNEVPAGQYTLVVYPQNFLRQEVAVECKPEENAPVRIYLERDPGASFETTIESNEAIDPVEKTLSKTEAARLPGAGADPIRAVQNIPGVNRTPGFGSTVVIQGSAPEDTRYTIDGHQIPLIFHFAGLSSVFNPDLTESFDYLSAGYQSNYSRAMGGVIGLNTRTLESDHFKGSAFFDTFNSGVTVETPIDEHSKIAVAGRISYIGQVLKAALSTSSSSSNNFSLTVAPSYSDIGLIYDRDLSSRLKFKLVGIGSSDSLQFLLSAPVGNDPALRGNFYSSTGFFRLIPEWTWTHSPLSTTQFSAGLGRDFIVTSIGSEYLNIKSWATTFRIENRTRLSDTFTSVVGMDHSLSWSDVSFHLPVFYTAGGVSNPVSSATQITTTVTGVNASDYGLYVNPIWKPASDSPWTFYPGARFDYFNEVTSALVSPRLGSRYAWTPSLALVSAFGLYTQPPLPQEYNSAYGNPKLKSPSAWHSKIGLEKDLSQELSKGSEFDTGFYGRWYQNLVISDTSTLYSNAGAGKSFGWENSFKWALAPWNFWLAYTLSRSTRSDPLHTEYLFDYDQTHFLTVIAGVDLGSNWRLSGRFRYVTGTLVTVPTSGVGDLDNDVFIPITGALNNARLDPFIQLDLRADKKWIYRDWTLSLYLDIQNALNRANAESLQFAYDYSSSQNISGIPILPTFGLKGEF